MRTIDIKTTTWLNMIEGDVPFSFSRFGDGEVLCMFPIPTINENCDGSRFLPELKEPMKQIFRNNYEYFHAILNCTFWTNGDKFKKFIEETCPDMLFVMGDFWQDDISANGRIPMLTNLLSQKEFCFIGNERLRNLQYVENMQLKHFIEIPAKDSFLKFKEIKQSILDMYAKGVKRFAFSAGYTTKILIDELFPIIGEDATMIDFGSVFDPYCGVLSRTSMRDKGVDWYQKYTSFEL